MVTKARLNRLEIKMKKSPIMDDLLARALEDLNKEYPAEPGDDRDVLKRILDDIGINGDIRPEGVKMEEALRKNKGSVR